MKHVIKIAVMVMSVAVGTAALSAQAAGAKQTPPPASKPADKSAKPEEKNPCKPGEVLKDPKAKMDKKTNPCVKK